MINVLIKITYPAYILNINKLNINITNVMQAPFLFL